VGLKQCTQIVKRLTYINLQTDRTDTTASSRNN